MPTPVIHRLRWTIAGWVLGLTLVVIDGPPLSGGR
jgi:hypothetical protein